VDLKNAAERAADALKYQRLNVGFSRAKECVHFVLSKPIERFSGSVRVALQHFNRLVQDKSKAEPNRTGPDRSEVADGERAARVDKGDLIQQLDPFTNIPGTASTSR
jgi:hypothetical protein